MSLGGLFLGLFGLERLVLFFHRGTLQGTGRAAPAARVEQLDRRVELLEIGRGVGLFGLGLQSSRSSYT